MDRRVPSRMLFGNTAVVELSKTVHVSLTYTVRHTEGYASRQPNDMAVG